MRVGTGYDVHRLAEGRKLVIGGVEIPGGRGLLGHSDADVLLHAIMDALLGAAGLGDIGLHFPDTDPQYEGASSVRLLERVSDMLLKEGYVVSNVDATVIAQQPKMRPYIGQMEQNIAGALGISKGQVNVKATTEEGLGFTGEGLGMAAQAVCLIESLYEGSFAVAQPPCQTGACGAPCGACGQCPAAGAKEAPGGGFGAEDGRG